MRVPLEGVSSLKMAEFKDGKGNWGCQSLPRGDTGHYRASSTPGEAALAR